MQHDLRHGSLITFPKEDSPRKQKEIRHVFSTLPLVCSAGFDIFAIVPFVILTSPDIFPTPFVCVYPMHIYLGKIIPFACFIHHISSIEAVLYLDNNPVCVFYLPRYFHTILFCVFYQIHILATSRFLFLPTLIFSHNPVSVCLPGYGYISRR